MRNSGPIIIDGVGQILRLVVCLALHWPCAFLCSWWGKLVDWWRWLKFQPATCRSLCGDCLLDNSRSKQIMCAWPPQVLLAKYYLAQSRLSSVVFADQPSQATPSQLHYTHARARTHALFSTLPRWWDSRSKPWEGLAVRPPWSTSVW